MSTLVADASALVSLGGVTDGDVDPLALCFARYEVVIPTVVVEELREIASDDDVHGRGATTVLDRTAEFDTKSVALDATFPLDDGENAAVSLANNTDAELLLCDEFNQLGRIHASLADTGLVTTPTLLSVLVHTEELSGSEAQTLLAEISDTRSWETNSYVQRARSLLEDKDR